MDFGMWPFLRSDVQEYLRRSQHRLTDLEHVDKFVERDWHFVLLVVVIHHNNVHALPLSHFIFARLHGLALLLVLLGSDVWLERKMVNTEPALEAVFAQLVAGAVRHEPCMVEWF